MIVLDTSPQPEGAKLDITNYDDFKLFWKAQHRKYTELLRCNRSLECKQNTSETIWVSDDGIFSLYRVNSPRFIFAVFSCNDLTIGPYDLVWRGISDNPNHYWPIKIKYAYKSGNDLKEVSCMIKYTLLENLPELNDLIKCN